jgi:SAM-dependent methyltransferase
MIPTPMTSLDFEGDYGRHYATSIRRSIPAYDALFEIGAATLAAFAAEASSALVVGPGLGEELPGMLAALPQARFTLLEPSAQMGQGCAAVIAREGAGGRCNLLQSTLQDAGPLADTPFAVVICHHVLHLMPPAQQRPLLRQLCAQVAPGGQLLLSSFSEPAEALQLETNLVIARCRLRQLGMDEDTLRLFMAGRNTVVFSLAEALLAEELVQAGLEPPQLLVQALSNRLWLSRRP